MISTMPAARWQPARNVRRPIIGQVAQDVLTVSVFKDDRPAAGIPVEVMFQDGSAADGVTGEQGTFAAPYSAAQRGQAVVRITPPADVEDLGEASAQGVALQGGPAIAVFELASAGAPGEENPVVGLGVAALLYGLVLA